ncbi:hypothetical protein KIN20_032417 [Parelaphostrongylus tenuis]|uniref:Uncharacterized protein n=1 Tax=Parelaphostrongylus tenuis TaxID=148309 RepID=A0AAD5WHP8_PARTN|nr:hypothetical protein KIN20_032417 [Parelaphostrongylus tenuis]
MRCSVERVMSKQVLVLQGDRARAPGYNGVRDRVPPDAKMKRKIDRHFVASGEKTSPTRRNRRSPRRTREPTVETSEQDGEAGTQVLAGNVGSLCSRTDAEIEQFLRNMDELVAEQSSTPFLQSEGSSASVDRGHVSPMERISNVHSMISPLNTSTPIKRAPIKFRPLATSTPIKRKPVRDLEYGAYSDVTYGGQLSSSSSNEGYFTPPEEMDSSFFLRAKPLRKVFLRGNPFKEEDQL